MTEAGFSMIGCDCEDGPNIEMRFEKFSWSITYVLIINLLVTLTNTYYQASTKRSAPAWYSLLALLDQEKTR